MSAPVQPPLYCLESDPSLVGGCARIVEQDLQRCAVVLPGKRLELSLTFAPDAIQPVFSGACWAGTVVWPAALLLCDHLQAHAAAVAGRRVVELGCGLGIPGMASHVLGAASVTLTEQDPLPDLLRANVAANFALDGPDVAKLDEVNEGGLDDASDARNPPQVNPPQVNPPQVNPPQVRLLDWNDAALGKSIDPLFADVDLVLISDCIYKELYGDSWRVLADCIKGLLQKGRQGSQGTRAASALNSLERRKDDGVDEFLAYSSDIGLKWTLLRDMRGPEAEHLQLYEMTLS